MINKVQLLTKQNILDYSIERRKVKLGGETKHKNTRLRKIKLSSLNNLISYYKGIQDYVMCEILYKELEYRNFIKEIS